VRLVDSLDEGGSGDVAFPTYRVEVTVGGRTDTIAGFRTDAAPVVGPDGRVYVFGNDHGFVGDGYIYNPNTRAVETFPTPPGAGQLEAHMSISPDARHIAYISTECVKPSGCGVVRSWPDGKLIAETPGGVWCEGDEDHYGVRWLDTNRAELVYCSQQARGFLLHAIVTVDSRQVLADSLRSKPDWMR